MKSTCPWTEFHFYYFISHSFQAMLTLVGRPHAAHPRFTVNTITFTEGWQSGYSCQDPAASGEGDRHRQSILGEFSVDSVGKRALLLACCVFQQADFELRRSSLMSSTRASAHIKTIVNQD